MANLYFADRVACLCRDTGPGPLGLDEAMPGCRAFAGAVPASTPFAYAIAGIENAGEWECGVGHLDAEGRLVRSPAHSSADGDAVDFTAQLKSVALTVNAEWLADRQAVSAPAITDIPGLAAALAGKQPAGSYQPAGNYAATSHGHVVADVTGLAAVLAGKSDDGHGHGFTSLTDKPTTLAGYGITDAASSGHGHSFASLTAKPTTLAGYGITDAASSSHTHGYLPLSGGGLTGTLIIGGVSPLFGEKLGLHSDADGSAHILIRNTNSGSSVYSGLLLNSYGNSWIMRMGGTSANANALEFINDPLGSGTMRMRLKVGGPVEFFAPAVPGTDNSFSCGSASYRWSVIYAASGTINTSDEREKRDIGPVPDDWLDAWGEVQWSRYRFTGGRRWHVGLVAQRVRRAFRRRGVDAFEIGLLCRDKFGRRTRWGLRYDECFAMEAAWMRRELARMQAGLCHAG